MEMISFKKSSIELLIILLFLKRIFIMYFWIKIFIFPCIKNRREDIHYFFSLIITLIVMDVENHWDI